MCKTAACSRSCTSINNVRLCTAWRSQPSVSAHSYIVNRCVCARDRLRTPKCFYVIGGRQIYNIQWVKLSVRAWVDIKGSYDIAKRNIILCIWCNAMCLCSLRFKNTLFSTYCTLLLLLYALPFWNAPIFTKLIVLRSDWPAIVHCDWSNNSSVWGKYYTPYHIVMPCPGATRQKQ